MMFVRVLAAAAAIAGIGGFAASAAAQPYDDDYYDYPNPGAQILQGVIDSLLGTRYNVTDRRAVHSCASAALNEAWMQYRPYGGGPFGPAYGYGYGNYPQMRVTAITAVDRRATGLRVHGLIDSGLFYGPGPRHPMGDLMFRCDVDYRGRVWNVRVTRNPDFQPY